MKQELQLLKSASQEIKNLRIQNEKMALRLRMFDDMMSVFNSEPSRSGCGMGEDIVYYIDKFVESAKLSESEENNNLKPGKNQ